MIAARLRSLTAAVRMPLAAAFLSASVLAQPVASTGPRQLAQSYDLGTVTIEQLSQAPGSRFRQMPVGLRGVIAVPAKPGPHPVALFIHGSYLFCDAAGVDPEVDAYPCPPESDLRQFEGFGYLMEALAEQGYVAIAPDLSAEFNNGFGEPAFGERSGQIIDAHLEALMADEGFGVDVADKVDPQRLAVIGHSRGGSLAVRYIDRVGDRSIAALVLLTPAYLIDDETIPPDLGTALVMASCDGDVGTEQPLLFLEQLAPLRPAITTITTLPGGTHEGFSTRLEVRPSPACDAADVMPAEQQQAWLAAFLPAFLDLALGDGVGSDTGGA